MLELGRPEDVDVLSESLRDAVVAEVVAALLTEPNGTGEGVQHEKHAG